MTIQALTLLAPATWSSARSRRPIRLQALALARDAGRTSPGRCSTRPAPAPTPWTTTCWASWTRSSISWRSRSPTGLVIRSAKPAGFIAGADVNSFGTRTTSTRSSSAWPAPTPSPTGWTARRYQTIAVVHGYALGGGLEVALACKVRIAVDGAKFGFPEVQLGLHPGLGGTARFTRLIDPLQAMSFMLTGKTIAAKKAKALGLVDAVVPERHVRAAVRRPLSGAVERRRPEPDGSAQGQRPGSPQFAAGRMRDEAGSRRRRSTIPRPTP
jgi:3-hydroxyacyl-CoA dehydrogenase/enoyl-CoA hydratase/3-hydroxybutyryl-CoA epimerase